MSRLHDARKFYQETALDGTILSCRDLTEYINKQPTEHDKPLVDEETLFNYLTTPPVSTELLEQGIPLIQRQHTSKDLTVRQLNWLSAVTNPYTSLSLSQLAAKHGVTLEEHQAWLMQSNFKNLYQKRLSKQVGLAQGEIVRKTANRATQGDPKSTELYHRMIGKPLPEALPVSSTRESISVADLTAILQQVLERDAVAAVASAIGQHLQNKPNERELRELNGPMG